MIGYEPITEELLISRGAPFSHYLAVTDDPFPTDTQVTLYIYSRDGQTLLGFWPAVLVEDGGAQLQVDSEDLDVVPDGAGFRIYVTYPDSVPVVWYRGRTWRKD